MSKNLLGKKNIAILLIEDNMGDAVLVQEYLLDTLRFRAGLTHCTSIQDAMAHLSEQRPDIILLDLSLPDAQDLGGLRRLRHEGYTIPIVVLTGRKDEIAIEALQAGAQDYLNKDDMSPTALERGIQYALERHQFQQRLYQEEEQRLLLQHQVEHERLITSLINGIYHEFRNPLSVINTSATIMAKLHPDEKMHKHQLRIENTVARLVQIVDYMAQMTRLSGSSIVEEPASLSLVCQKLHYDYTHIERLRFADLPHDYQLAMSEDHLLALLNYLIDNALRFSDNNSPVHITCKQEDDYIIISVQDEGIGIAPEHLEKVLLPFYKVDDSRHFDANGAGLGLTIGNMIVKTYGGTLTILSVPDEGTNVLIRLPLYPQPAPMSTPTYS
jgi:signal transduction histidine kinase